MLRDNGDTTLTGRFKWETVYCTKCKERTTHWLMNDSTSKCAMCNSEKPRDAGLGLNLNDKDA